MDLNMLHADEKRPEDHRWPDELAVSLDKPLKHGGESWSGFTLREPRVEEVLRAVAKPDVFTQMRTLIAVVSGVPEAALGGLAASAYRRAADYLGHFLAAEAPPTSEADGTPAKSLMVEFAAPITAGAVERDRIVLHEPTLSMLMLASKAGSQLSQDVELVALAGMPSGASRAIVEKMRYSDFVRARDFVTGFTQAGATIV